jgi:hypothetical protein
MCSVPPETGFPALALLLLLGPVVDDELHAATVAAASTAAASPAMRLGVLIMGMFLLGQDGKRQRGTVWQSALRITTYQERLCDSASEIQSESAVVARL